MQKGALKIWDLCKGEGLKKKLPQIFRIGIEFTCFPMGLTCNFHSKKGALEFFKLRSEWGPKKFQDKIFESGPPYK